MHGKEVHASVQIPPAHWTLPSLAAHDAAIKLRPFQPQDASSLLEAVRESMAELLAWMAWCKPEYSLADSEAFIQKCRADYLRRDSICFAIIDTRDDALSGSVGLTQINRAHNFANLGIWVRSGRTRQGAATAATRLIAKFAFEELHLARIEIIAAFGNTASVRVAEKVGARREGVLRNRLILSGRLQDAVMYALLPQDLQRTAA